jgi:transmembrane sensor
MNREEYQQLIHKVSDGMATDNELALYNRYFHAYQKSEEWEESEMGPQQELKLKLDQLVFEQIRLRPTLSLKPLIFKIAIAAVLFIAVGIFLYPHLRPLVKENEIAKKAVIVPGGNKAYLTLGNGKRIELNDASRGQLAKEAGVEIRKTGDGQLVYSIKEQPASDQTLINTIETPKGGRYQVLLPDGTKVWLNAASKLTYPVSFTAKDSRKVELNGEAYFEVAKNDRLPFRVKTALQEIEVLGTHFNVMAYDDEKIIKTTLLEGAVKVAANHKQSLLYPGQQADLNRENQQIRITTAVKNKSVAWKNGYFMFTGDTIEDIMKQVGRWYDLEVEYRGNMSNKQFGGTYSMDKDIHELMKGLELTGMIHYKIEGRRIIVMD